MIGAGMMAGAAGAGAGGVGARSSLVNSKIFCAVTSGLAISCGAMLAGAGGLAAVSVKSMALSCSCRRAACSLSSSVDGCLVADCGDGSDFALAGGAAGAGGAGGEATGACGTEKIAAICLV